MSNKIIRVSDVMEKDFGIVDGNQTVSDVLDNMRTQTSRAVVVDKRDADDEYGLVLLSDIARQVLAKDRNPKRVNVYEIMTKPALSVSPDMKIRYCAQLFDNFHIHRAPVVKDGEVIGIVSYTDIVLKGLVEMLEDHD